MECSDDVRRLLAGLGIPLESLAARCLEFHPEACELVVVEIDDTGREHRLVAPAAQAWHAMKAAAAADGVAIRIVSAFRSVARQAEIVRAKLDKGQALEDILCVSAPPGFSEHHSGCALDLTTDGVRALEEEFEQTEAFRWLGANAGRFGFVLSFPRDNRYGYAYEPWHWRFEAPRRA
jgi:D-alanyl-D-alanine carboxypeptidase